ncbi:BFH_collapsed_G0021160.mRNA.1.CDS.1 [Saccharomyces cerevisiae]|nr:BFH_collapsed_G0021160.mRNA.1.CDS.1 [Saccharomyces cerevisiae]
MPSELMALTQRLKNFTKDYKKFYIRSKSSTVEDILFQSLTNLQDEEAIRYQNSERAAQEFPNKPPLVKYCIALARYIQSPKWQGILAD